MDINQFIINEIANRLGSGKTKLSSARIAKIKRKASKKYGKKCPTNIELLESYRKMAKCGEIKPDKILENALITKDTRTISGVAVIAVLTNPYPCPGACIYCPNEKNMPKSYLSNEPAVMRAILTGFDPYKQVQARIKSLEATGHKTDKIELIVMGGTFSYLPEKYQTWFIKECFRACDEKPKSQKPKAKTASGRLQTLAVLQKQNERSKHRIVGLTLETRPDYINKEEILRMRELGATRVELGVQSIYDDVLKLNGRGHGRSEIIEATRLLKDAGFKINYHMMPNLPGSSFRKDVSMFRELFSNPDFHPDLVKIYPCVVVKNAPIYKWWKKGKYRPYSGEKLLDLLSEIKKNLPYYVRVTRVIRDIPSTSIVAGNKISNLRQVLDTKSAKEGWRCKCIRCREIRNAYADENQSPVLELFREDYPASDGLEIFLSFEDSKRKNLYSMLRLRINPDVIATRQSRNSAKKTSRLEIIPTPSFKGVVIPALENAAIIREVHTYGQLVSISAKNKRSPQHTGLGKKLIAEAERIAQEEFEVKKIAVISGVGVRDYYRKLGYRLKDGYMIKCFKIKTKEKRR